jgi:hypothetical protein
MIKKIIIALSLFFMTISFSSATELNEQVFYNGVIKNAYNQNNLPVLPGNWKVYDLEKSGSVPSGNFYVYATLVPEIMGPTDNAFNYDGINYAVLGSKSEETEYRKSFYACDAGWITDAKTTTSNINSRGSGNFEETCSVIGEINQFYTFFFTDCNENCVEVNFALHQQSYNISDTEFASVSDKIFAAIRSIVNGQGIGEFDQILLDYKL